MEEKRDIKSLSYEEVLTFAEELGEKKFRNTTQIVIATDIKGIWDLLARLYRDPLRPQIFCQLFHRNIAGIDTDTGFLFL